MLQNMNTQFNSLLVTALYIFCQGALELCCGISKCLSHIAFVMAIGTSRSNARSKFQKQIYGHLKDKHSFMYVQGELQAEVILVPLFASSTYFTSAAKYLVQELCIN